MKQLFGHLRIAIIAQRNTVYTNKTVPTSWDGLAWSFERGQTRSKEEHDGREGQPRRWRAPR
jgi:hypothetical protein